MTSAPSPGSGTGNSGTRPGLGKRLLGATDTSGVDRHRVIGVVIAVLAIVLIVQNSSSTELHVLMFSFHAPVWVMCILTLVLGGVAWELFKRGRRRRRNVDVGPTGPASGPTVRP